MMELNPINNYVVLQPVEEPEKTSGGIIVPDAAKARWKVAKVLSLAEEDFYMSEIEKGDFVLFNPATGMPVPDGSGRLIVRQGDLVAVLEGFQPGQMDHTTDEVSR